MKESVSAVIVAFNTPTELAAAVCSLRAQTLPPEEIVIVDNGACEGTPSATLVAESDGTRVIRPMRNLGFGAGCNVGRQAVTHDHLLLLMNADVVMAPDATESLVRSLAERNRVAVAGPRIYAGEELQLSARTFPSVRTGLLGRRSVLTQLLRRLRSSPQELRHAHGGGGTVDWVSGACILVRPEAFEQVSGFDEAFWMYWEDADLCRRLWDRGWSVRYEPNAVAHHATGASGMSDRTIIAFHESAAEFARRYLAGGKVQAVLYRALLGVRKRVILLLFRRSQQASGQRAVRRAS